MLDVEPTNSSVRHEPGNCLQEKLELAVQSVRNLQLYLDGIECTVRVLDEVSVLGEATKEAYTDNDAFALQHYRTVLLRKEFDRFVRQAMPFNRIK